MKIKDLTTKEVEKAQADYMRVTGKELTYEKLAKLYF